MSWPESASKSRERWLTMIDDLRSCTKLFTDGGMIGKNPSADGGTWCYVAADDNDCIVHRDDGVVTPDQFCMKAISNNFTELYAVLMGMTWLPEGWSGTIYTDSGVTKARLLRAKSFNGIPYNVLRSFLAERKRLGAFKVILLGGHPTRNDLTCGCRKDGKPVHKLNVFCDKVCKALSLKFRGPQ